MITIMITERCNYKCSHCLLTCNNRGIDITPDTLRNAQKILENSGGVNILGGEPFLNKQFDYVIQQLAFANTWQYVRIVSNGSWIYSKQKTEKVMNTYRSILHNGKFDSVELCISNDIYHQEFWKQSDHIKQIEREVEDAGLTEYNGFYLVKSERKPEDVISLGRAKTEIGWCNMDSKGASCMDIIYDKQNNPENDIYPLEDLFIYPNGDYSPCCQGVVKIGNINRESMDTINGKLLAFYDSLLNKDLHFGDCKNCAKINAEVIKEITKD